MGKVLRGLLSIGLAAAGVHSTSASADARTEIIVTGERISRTARQTNSSVVVFDQGAIERASADAIDELLASVPNIQVGSGGEAPTIRGQDATGALRDLPAFLGGARPRTTMVVDARAVSFNEFVFGTSPLWDVAQVEFFRTPQTTRPCATATTRRLGNGGQS